jgi:hypothetical protein
MTTSVKEDKAREHRIRMEVIVDCFNECEEAMGWYSYLEDRWTFPFKAKCVCEIRTSPLKKGEIIEVYDMAPEDVCAHDMFVDIRWEKSRLAVPLSQLKAVAVDDETKEAMGDWHYWVARGYEL